MLKSEANSKYNVLIIAVIIFLAFFLVTNVYVSVKHLTIEEKARRFGFENLYGFYVAEEEDGTIYNWTGEEAVKLIERKGDLIFVTVGNDRPDIKENNVNLKVTVNNELEYNYAMNSNDWNVISIDIGEIKDDYVKVKFSVDSTWKPADVVKNSKDNRILGVKVGEIYWGYR